MGPSAGSARSGSALQRIRIAQAALTQSETADFAPESPGTLEAGRMTRRRLLQGAGATAVTLGLGNVWPGRSHAEGDPGPRVVVVGAGIAGLGCAYRLWRRHGYAPRSTSGQIGRVVGSGLCAATSTTASWSRSTPSSSTPSTRRRWLWPATCILVSTTPTITRRRPTANRSHSGSTEAVVTGGGQPRLARVRVGLFRDAAANAPWPTTHSRSSTWAARWDQMSVVEWIDHHLPGGSG